MAQVLELPNRNDKVVDFRWEPRGSRFAVLHGEGPKPALSVYAMNDMRTSARGVQHLGSQPGKQANCIHWSPQVRALPAARTPCILVALWRACQCRGPTLSYAQSSAIMIAALARHMLLTGEEEGRPSGAPACCTRS